MRRNKTLTQFTSLTAYFDWITHSNGKLQNAYDRILRAMIQHFRSKPVSRNELKYRYFNPDDVPRVEDGVPTMAKDGQPRMGHSSVTGRVSEMYCLKQQLLANKKFDTDEEYEEALLAACDFPHDCSFSTQDKKCMGILAVAKIELDPYSSDGQTTQKLVPLTPEGRKHLRNQDGQITMGF